MKTTFVFTGARNFKNILQGFVSKVNLSIYDYNILFLTNENTNLTKEDLPQDISYSITVFDNYSTENEMIEYLFQNEKLENVIIVKNSYQNINFEDFNRILKEAQKGREVVISKQNKQENFFTKIWKNIKKFVIKSLFGFKIYDAEADIVFLNPLAVSIIKQSPKRSAMFVNINSWAGLEPFEVLISSQPKNKSQIKTSKTFYISLITSSIILLGMLIGHVIFSVFKIKLTFLLLLTYILLEIVLFGFIIFYVFKMLFLKKYGKLNFINEAILTQTINNNIEGD